MRILLSGYSGAMGRVISQMCRERQDDIIVAGYAKSKHEVADYPVYTDLSQIQEKVDVIIDFSKAEAVAAILDYGKQQKIPMVIASTGLGVAEYKKIEDASKEVAILQSGNMSLGINLLLDIVQEVAAKLTGFDVEIIEKHHNKKVDAPSGTANMLAQAVSSGRDDLEQIVYGRSGKEAKRQQGEIGIHAIRGGTIVGEHSVIFAGTDEVIEIKHSAASKKIFANGALKAANFIVKQTKGLYSMEDVLR